MWGCNIIKNPPKEDLGDIDSNFKLRIIKYIPREITYILTYPDVEYVINYYY